ncbi:MAG TPA: hypothetical protein VM145_01800, partial [Sphingomicrobium sp.]|nr:hypothetical protein [Sphingomicrobium sp.]
MRSLAFAALIIASASAMPVAAAAPLRDPVALNIGLNCAWQKRCIAQQHHAMKRALAFVSKKQPAAWR